MKKIYFPLLAISIALQANAQEDSVRSKQLDEVVVTGSKTSIKQSQTGKIITVIDSETIRNNAGHTLTELLNTQAGFMLIGSNNTMGTNIENYFRGADAGNLLIVVDGVPVTDPSQISNTFDLNSIPLEQIDRIEILKGGQSTIWGSDAVAGLVQIFLRKKVRNHWPQTGTSATARTTHSGQAQELTEPIKNWDIKFNTITREAMDFPRLTTVRERKDLIGMGSPRIISRPN